jgi:hypothetical protein
MPVARNLTKQDIERAQKYTKSNRAAARFLGCSYNTYLLYAKMFIDEETGKTLFDKHLNRSGKGIPKWGNNGRDIPVDEILNGSAPRWSYSADKLKNVLLAETKLINHCYKCGFHEERVTDYKVPLLLNYRDNNSKNWKLDNLELLCYNCYFINVGDVFTSKQITAIEDEYIPTKSSEPNFEIDDSWMNDENLQHFKELLDDNIDLTDEDNYISYND